MSADGAPAARGAGGPAAKGTFRWWCWTCFDTDEDDELNILGIDGWLPHHQYTVAGGEICPTTGERHFQCCTVLNNPCREIWLVKQLKAAGLRSIYVEPAWADDKAKSVNYCKKDGKFMEMGALIGQGKGKASGQSKEVITMIKEGKTMRDMMDTFPSLLRCQNNVRQAQLLYQDQGSYRNLEVRVFYGTPGSGKSKAALELAKEKKQEYWVRQRSKEWWDGYDGQKTIVWNDFDWREYPYQALMQVLDVYTTAVQWKGTYVPFNANLIIITAVESPKLWYYDRPRDKITDLLRRISSVRHFVSAVDEVPKNFGDECARLGLA